MSLHWNGTSWSQIPAAHLRSGGVAPVAALSPASVWAVGTGPGVPTGGFSAHPTAVIEHWDGTSWSVVPSPNPNPQGNNSLGAVAAVSASNVWAVGLQLQGPAHRALERHQLEHRRHSGRRPLLRCHGRLRRRERAGSRPGDEPKRIILSN